MARAEREAISIIQRCVDAGRYRTTRHFLQRLDQRGIFWPEVEALIHSPEVVRFDRLDVDGSERWILGGFAVDEMEIEVVCVIEHDERGHLTVLVTIYWKE